MFSDVINKLVHYIHPHTSTDVSCVGGVLGDWVPLFCPIEFVCDSGKAATVFMKWKGTQT